MLNAALIVLATTVVLALLLGTEAGMRILGAAIILVPGAAMVIEGWGVGGLITALKYGAPAFVFVLFTFHLVRAMLGIRREHQGDSSS